MMSEKINMLHEQLRTAQEINDFRGEQIRKYEAKFKQYNELLDEAIDAPNMSYDVQYVNWIHKDIANLLDEGEE